jgi:hypothetical protein
MVRKAVHAISLVQSENTLPSAACTPAAQAENDLKGHTHPPVQGARNVPAMPAARNVRIDEPLEDGSMDPEKPLTARAFFRHKTGALIHKIPCYRGFPDR